jgi:hypothetical protein
MSLETTEPANSQCVGAASTVVAAAYTTSRSGGDGDGDGDGGGLLLAKCREAIDAMRLEVAAPQPNLPILASAAVTAGNNGAVVQGGLGGEGTCRAGKAATSSLPHSDSFLAYAALSSLRF